MSNRYDTKEIRSLTAKYSQDEFFCSMCPLAGKWETELPNLGLNAVEYYEAVMDVMKFIVVRGKSLTQNHVHGKLDALHADIRRYDERKSPQEETAQAVACVYFLVGRILYSSRNVFYRKTVLRGCT